jgi:GntR family transcriptional regulator
VVVPSPSPREPKYYLVKRHLMELVERLEPGSLLPTERLLTEELRTSRTTVRRALSELVGEGRLVRRQGSGTFVAEPKITWSLQMTSFTEQAAVAGLSAGTQLLHTGRERADEGVAERLGVAPGKPVYCVERLRLVNDAPMAIETSYLAAARFPGLLGHVRKSASLYQVLLEVYATKPASAEETIETAAASPHEAELLQTETGAPILMLSRHSYDEAGEPVEWVRSWYRGDRYRFTARLTAP